MKCNELKAEPMIINDDYTALYYPKDSVDAAIAELKEVYKDSVDVKVKIWERCKKAEDELRNTQRALWLARGYIMTLLQRDFQRLAYQCNNDDYKKNLLRRRNRYYDLNEKCRANAEEYK